VAIVRIVARRGLLGQEPRRRQQHRGSGQRQGMTDRLQEQDDAACGPTFDL
jgi:hypothetical protein